MRKDATACLIPSLVVGGIRRHPTSHRKVQDEKRLSSPEKSKNSLKIGNSVYIVHGSGRLQGPRNDAHAVHPRQCGRPQDGTLVARKGHAMPSRCLSKPNNSVVKRSKGRQKWAMKEGGEAPGISLGTPRTI